MARSAVRLSSALAILSIAAAAHAQSPDPLARARTHFEAGRALYNLENYTDALREFSAGYQLAPRPQFLVNLGQCYRKLGGHENLLKARDMYRKFLDEAQPSDPDREQVKSLLADLEQELAAAPPPEPKPAAEPPPQQQNVVVATAPPPKKPFIKRHWWIIPVAVIVVGAAVGLGAYYGTRSSQVDCGSASLGCIDGSGMK